ncbi:hypothetical protein [Bacillus atrophaeus]|uniref:hypothetical protein n=1 Tax=Bacillus atrophaeus TaxID=1452 RepID=UPI002E12F462
MDKLMLGMLLSLFMVFFPPSDVVLPSQLDAAADSQLQVSSYPQETQSAKTASPASLFSPMGKEYDPLARVIFLLSVKPLDQSKVSILDKICSFPIKYQSNYLRS